MLWKPLWCDTAELFGNTVGSAAGSSANRADDVLVQALHVVTKCMCVSAIGMMFVAERKESLCSLVDPFCVHGMAVLECSQDSFEATAAL